MLWSCVTCGACVEQCPVDIEHVDHIVDMRRYQVLVENNFPAELNGLFKGMESRGNPWNLSPNARLDWAKDLDVEIKVVGDTIESLDEVDWLFWVGCAGAYEDRAKKTTRAVAELLDMAGVSFGVLGNGETCTGDSARRAGNEFLFQGLAQQNVETFKEYKVKKVVSTCAHCFNTLKNEYKEFGVELEVVHHTQLLNRLVREGKLTPVTDGEGAHKRSITYHDPCYIGRHNGVYSPPRELLEILPGAQFVEMERNSERSFCCGAGGARMWMEETIGKRINNVRTEEAIGTGADQIAVGCPFCRVMLDDGLTAAQAGGDAREEVEVLDIAQMLLASVKGTPATKLKPGEGGQPATKVTKEPAEEKVPAAKAASDEPGGGDQADDETTVKKAADVGPAAKASSSGGSSLFDEPAASVTTDEDATPAEEAQAAKPASSGGSLFDVGGDDQPAAAEKAPEAKTEQPAKTEAAASSGGSLFDLGDEPEPEAATEKAAPAPAVSSGGSLFDIAEEEPAAPAAKAETETKSEPETTPEPEPEPAGRRRPPSPPAARCSTSPRRSPRPRPRRPRRSRSPSRSRHRSPKQRPRQRPKPRPRWWPSRRRRGHPSVRPGRCSTSPRRPRPAHRRPSRSRRPRPHRSPSPSPKRAEPEPEKAEEKPKPAPSGDAHQPKTDADIGGASSLFDL